MTIKLAVIANANSVKVNVPVQDVKRGSLATVVKKIAAALNSQLEQSAQQTNSEFLYTS